MSGNRIGFLCNIASTLSTKHETHKLLRSYYLMRCTQVTRGYGFPEKHFSTKARCPRCCLEWARDTAVKVKPIKLKKRQKQKNAENKTELLKGNFEKSNEMEQICTFCQLSTTTKLTKPEKEYIKLVPLKEGNKVIKDNQQKQGTIEHQKKANINKKALTKTKTEMKNNTVVNVYCNTFNVFSLKNEKNTLSSAIREPSKVIKNNKKKKDKFAGLCQKAVLASAKLKHEKQTQQPQTFQNKLNLFLKPSSG